MALSLSGGNIGVKDRLMNIQRFQTQYMRCSQSDAFSPSRVHPLSLSASNHTPHPRTSYVSSDDQNSICNKQRVPELAFLIPINVEMRTISVGGLTLRCCICCSRPQQGISSGGLAIPGRCTQHVLLKRKCKYLRYKYMVGNNESFIRPKTNFQDPDSSVE